MRAYQENPHLCLQILHAARFQVFRGAYILLRVLADTKSQEAQGLLEEIRRQSSVSVLSGPAIVITKVATASVSLAKGWSTESTSRVVRNARTTQEKHEKERAEHAYYSHMHDDVAVYDVFQENTTALDDQEDETVQSLSESLQTRRQISKIHENMGHPSNRTLVRVLRLGGAKRRFILAAARHKCGACTDTSSWSNRESFTHFLCVQRRCRTLPVLIKHIRKAHFACHEHRVLERWDETRSGTAGGTVEEWQDTTCGQGLEGRLLQDDTRRPRSTDVDRF